VEIQVETNTIPIMIKVFRHIRKRLLSEGKTGKYLKYAIGEIVLVVIGILIALSINNWNEQRKEEKTLHEYLFKIADNISEDINMAKEMLLARDRLKHINKQAYKDLLNNIYDIKLLIKAGGFFREFYFIPNKSGFQALTNSGYIGKLKGNKLDVLLNDYYAVVDNIKHQELSYNNFIENIEVQFRTKFPMIRYGVLTNPESSIITSDSLKQALIQSQNELLPYFLSNEFQAGVNRTVIQDDIPYRKLIKEGEEFINEVSRLSDD